MKKCLPRYDTPERRVVIGFISWTIASLGFSHINNTWKDMAWNEFITPLIPAKQWLLCSQLSLSVTGYPK